MNESKRKQIWKISPKDTDHSPYALLIVQFKLGFDHEIIAKETILLLLIKESPPPQSYYIKITS